MNVVDDAGCAGRDGLSAHSNVADLKRSAMMRFQHRHYHWLAALSGLLLPAIIAGCGWGDWGGGFLFAGVSKAVLLNHSTFCINSLAHWVGDHTFSDQRTPRDCWYYAARALAAARGDDSAWCGAPCRRPPRAAWHARLYTHLAAVAAARWVSLVTFGEGYHNFHHEFPYDYRNGIEPWHFDPTKWLIRALDMAGLASDLKRFPHRTIEKGRLQMEQKRLDARKARFDWGPDAADLPRMSRGDMEARCAEGAALLLIDGLVHDVTDFIGKHPAGPAFIKPYLGKDASLAFHGGIYNHSHAAMNILRTLRVARIEP